MERKQLVEALRKWTARNPPKPDEDLNHEKPPSLKLPFKPPPKFPKQRDRVFNSRQEGWKTSPFVYCEMSEHKSVDCDKKVGVALRKKFLSEKRLCFKTALVQGTGLRTVISLEIAKNVMADNTHQSVIGIPNRCC